MVDKFENKEDTCPKCGSNDLEKDEPEYVNFSSGVCERCVCKKCGAEFNQWYSLVFSEILED